MNRRAEMPRPLVGIPNHRMTPHGQAGHGERRKQAHHRGADKVVVNVTSGQERDQRADRDL